MQVSEQTDSLRVLGTDPVDYLVSPRVLACMIAGPVLNIMCFAMGEFESPLISDVCLLTRALLGHQLCSAIAPAACKPKSLYPLGLCPNMVLAALTEHSALLGAVTPVLQL